MENIKPTRNMDLVHLVTSGISVTFFSPLFGYHIISYIQDNNKINDMMQDGQRTIQWTRNLDNLYNGIKDPNLTNKKKIEMWLDAEEKGNIVCSGCKPDYALSVCKNDTAKALAFGVREDDGPITWNRQNAHHYFTMYGTQIGNLADSTASHRHYAEGFGVMTLVSLAFFAKHVYPFLHGLARNRR